MNGFNCCPKESRLIWLQILTLQGPVMELMWYLPSRQKQVYNRRIVRTVLSPTMTTTVGQSGPCLLGVFQNFVGKFISLDTVSILTGYYQSGSVIDLQYFPLPVTLQNCCTKDDEGLFEGFCFEAISNFTRSQINGCLPVQALALTHNFTHKNL